jgi:hypothetical protein
VGRTLKIPRSSSAIKKSIVEAGGDTNTGFGPRRSAEAARPTGGPPCSFVTNSVPFR